MLSKNKKLRCQGMQFQYQYAVIMLNIEQNNDGHTYLFQLMSLMLVTMLTI